MTVGDSDHGKVPSNGATSSAAHSSKDGEKVITPGAKPTLSPKIAEMVSKSKSIEREQRALIAKKIHVEQDHSIANKRAPDGTDDDDDDYDNDNDNDNDDGPSAHGNSRDKDDDDDDQLSMPLPKKLKRDRVPSPLDLEAPMTNRDTHRTVPLQRISMPSSRVSVPYPYYMQVPLQFPPNPWMYCYPPPQYMQPSVPVAPQYTMTVPHTAVPQGVGSPPLTRHRVHFQTKNGGYTDAKRPNPAPNSTKGPPVMDVYPAGVMKEAPIQAQPLSAQRTKFQEDHPMVQQSKEGVEENTAVTPPPSSSTSSPSEHGEIDGEIRLNNDLFYYKLTSTPGKSSKAKFMKLCSSVWDEYTRM